MEELLKSLLKESDLLTEETQQKITEAFTKHIDEQVEVAREEETARVKAQLTEQWVQEREYIIEAVDSKVDEQLVAEISDLKADIERFRDLEAEYAGKLVESRAEMAEELKQDMAVLIREMDKFMEERLSVEFEELREDLEAAKRDRFGRQIFEAFAKEFNVNFVDEDSTQAKLQEMSAKLAQAEKTVTELSESKSQLERKTALSELLQPLSGRRRDIMESILQTTSTEKLSETYDKFINRVLNESVDPNSEKEKGVLAEGEQQKSGKKISESVIVKDGNTESNSAEKLNESSTLSPEAIATLRRLSGLQA